MHQLSSRAAVVTRPPLDIKVEVDNISEAASNPRGKTRETGHQGRQGSVVCNHGWRSRWRPLTKAWLRWNVSKMVKNGQDFISEAEVYGSKMAKNERLKWMFQSERSEILCMVKNGKYLLDNDVNNVNGYQMLFTLLTIFIWLKWCQ